MIINIIIFSYNFMQAAAVLCSLFECSMLRREKSIHMWPELAMPGQRPTTVEALQRAHLFMGFGGGGEGRGEGWEHFFPMDFYLKKNK